MDDICLKLFEKRKNLNPKRRKINQIYSSILIELEIRAKFEEVATTSLRCVTHMFYALLHWCECIENLLNVKVQRGKFRWKSKVYRQCSRALAIFEKKNRLKLALIAKHIPYIQNRISYRWKGNDCVPVCVKCGKKIVNLVAIIHNTILLILDNSSSITLVPLGENENRSLETLYVVFNPASYSTYFLRQFTTL